MPEIFNSDRIVQELKRKSLHLATILYPVLYNLVSYRLALTLAATLVILDLIFETLRLLYPSVNKVLLSIFEGTYREKEKENISTLIWTLSGAFLTILLFSDNRNVVTVSLLYLVFGDSIAAIVGVLFGSIRLGSRGKSLEGSLAFFVVAFVCGIIFFRWDIALIGALVASAIEFLPLPVDDNFILPIISAGLLTALV
jgi:dolichol kinase